MAHKYGGFMHHTAKSLGLPRAPRTRSGTLRSSGFVRQSLGLSFGLGVLAVVLVVLQFPPPSAPASEQASGMPAEFEMPFLPPNEGVVEPPRTERPPPQAVDDATAREWAAAEAASNAIPGPATPSAPTLGTGGGGTAAVPGAPQNHAVYAQVGSAFHVWATPADTGGKPITGYLPYRSTSPDFTQQLFIGSPGLGTAFQWGSLFGNTTYYFRVRAINDDGAGAFSNTVSATIPTGGLPGVPGNIDVRPLPTSVRANWSAPSIVGSSAITGYLTQVSNVNGEVLALQSTVPNPGSVLLSNFTAWSDLFFSVAAINNSGVGTFSAPSYFVPTNALVPQCNGDGVDGKRVEVLYAYAGAAPNPELLSAANGYSTRIERMLVESAADTGGVRHLRWRTNVGTAGCQLVITLVKLDMLPLPTTFQELRPILVGKGYSDSNRKYLTWVEDTTVPAWSGDTGTRVPCTANYSNDDRRGPLFAGEGVPDNPSNSSAIHSACSLLDGIGFGPGHELMHNMGAVQLSAPHSNGSFHCNQGFDPMCYGTGTTTDPQCADQIVFSYKYDCGHDDYFHTNPAPGSYLCTKWNVARSAFLTNNLDESVPSAPIEPLATAGNGQASLAWTVPTQQTCSGITGYTITATPGGATVNVGAVTSGTFPGLANDTPYTFTVRATTAGGPGPESAPSNQIVPSATGNTVPGAPTNVAAIPGDGIGNVTWAVPASNGGSPITGYRISATPGGAFVTVAPGTSGVMPGLTNGTSYTFTIRAQNTVGLSAPSPATNAVTPNTQRTYHGVTPFRLLDSRPPPEQVGSYNTPWAVGQSRDVQVAGVTNSNVPSTASAVVLNVTAVSPSAASFLTVWPAGDTRPTASNLNFVAGLVVPNLVVVKVGFLGRVSIYNNSGSVNVLADVVGYFDEGVGTGSRFTGVTPRRVLDSRPPPESVGGFTTPWSAGQTRELTLAGAAPVPANATEVVLNVTVTGATAGSFLTAWPSGVAKPNASNLNFSAGQTVANLVVVKVGTGGKISLFNNSGSVNVIADVVAYFSPTGAAYTPLIPQRILDSRPSPETVGPYNTPWLPAGDRELIVGTGEGNTVNPVPANAAGVVLNVTVIGGVQSSYITVYPSAGSDDTSNRPTASNINFLPGQVIPNLVMVPLGVGGKIRIYNSTGNPNIIADVVGYYR